MAGQNCSNCSAALPIVGGEELVRCSYCGTTNRARPPLRGTFKDGGRKVVLAIALLMLSVTAVVAGALLMLAPNEAPPAPSVSVGVPPALVHLIEKKAIKDAGVSPSELGTIAGAGWVPVAAPEIDGAFTAFDPILNLPWAEAMAKAWSTDARIQSIYISGVRADGGLDVSSRDDWDVDYRFFSPTLRESARAMARVSEETVNSELRLMVSESAVEALLGDLHSQRREDPPAYTPRCTFTGVMKRAVAAGLGERPTYGVMLTHTGSGWRWHVSGKDIDSATIKSASCPAG